MNLVKAELRDGKVTALSGKLEVPVNGAGRQGGSGPVTLGIRSEDVEVGANGAVEAKVHHVENHGVEKIVTLRVDDISSGPPCRRRCRSASTARCASA